VASFATLAPLALLQQNSVAEEKITQNIHAACQNFAPTSQALVSAVVEMVHVSHNMGTGQILIIFLAVAAIVCLLSQLSISKRFRQVFMYYAFPMKGENTWG
jgi:hypothetical protein